MKTVVRSSPLMPDSGPENSVIWFTSLGGRGSRPLRIRLDFTKCAALLGLMGGYSRRSTTRHAYP